MKFAFGASSVFACVFIASCSGPLDTSQKEAHLRPAEIHFENTAQDFGTIYQGQTASMTFVFDNIGEEPLIIEDVKSSCGCTAAAASSSEIMPGESGEIKVTFDSTGRLGKESKPIHVHTNDPDRAVLKLMVHGFIKSAVRTSPSYVNFGYVRQGTASAKTIFVRSEKGVGILEVETNSPYLLAGLEEGEAENEWNLKVTVADNAPLGTIRGGVFIHSTSEEQPVVRVGVFARVVGDITATPEDITFVYSESQQELLYNPQAIQVLSISETPFKITKLECKPKIMFFRSTHNSTSTKYSIVATVGKDHEIKAAEGSIYIHVDNPEQETIAVPFKITIRP